MKRQPRTLRLAFAGTPPFAVPALDALAAAKHDIRGVFTQADRPAGRGRALRESAVKKRAVELGLPVYQPEDFRSRVALGQLESLAVDAFVVAAYGLILPPAALAIPALGCFNIHASLLPRWRGAAPIQRAILAGDADTGISIMRMEAGLDTGPVLLKRSLAIAARDTSQTLGERLAALGGNLICEALAALAEATAVEVPQSSEGASYAAKVGKSEATIDWGGDAGDIVRKVRAFNPWPVAETRLRGAQLRIWEAQVAEQADPRPDKTNAGTGSPAAQLPGTVLNVAAGGIDVACGSGVVRITRLQLAGRRMLNAQQFANAERLAGVRLPCP